MTPVNHDGPRQSDRAEAIATARKQALVATEHAYSPYTGWRVGAAGITGKGALFLGCNVENSSFAMTLCAETSMIGTAVTAGDHTFSIVCCRLSDGTYLPPCGRCRQMLLEIAGLDCLIVLGDEDGDVVTVRELLPRPYSGDGLRLPDPVE